jgi:hypothetical protein
LDGRTVPEMVRDALPSAAEVGAMASGKRRSRRKAKAPALLPAVPVTP